MTGPPSRRLGARSPAVLAATLVSGLALLGGNLPAVAATSVTPVMASAALSGVGVGVGVGGEVVAPVDDPFARAREAAARVSFTGTVEVRWIDGPTEHREQLTVQSAGGSLLVEGGNQVMVSATSERLVRHEGGGWDLLWPPAIDRADRPDPSLKYQTAEHAGPDVAGRPTTVIDIRQTESALLREQVFLDRETELLLQRRQYDESGATARVVGFTSLRIDPTTLPPPSPSKAANLAPEPVAVASLASPALAPTQLADGYMRMGVYQRDGLVQVLYSDGLYDLSVFERRGALDRGDLGETGGPVQVGRAGGWRYAWPGGQVVLWQAGGTVYTLVSDAPLDQVLDAARDFPVPAARQPSLMERMRSVARTLIQPLA